MKALIISNMYPSSFNEIRGIFVCNQVKALAKQGCEVKVISPIPKTPFLVKQVSRKWKSYSEVPEKERRDGIEVLHPRYLEFPRMLFFASSGKRICTGIDRTVFEIFEAFPFDIIHSHMILPDGYAGMLLAEKYKRPLVVTVHGQDFQQTIHKGRRYRERIEEVIKYSKKTVTVSEKLRRIAEDTLGVDPGKISVVLNGIDPDELSLKKSDAGERYEGRTVILSVSNLRRIKGLDLNIRAISRLKDRFSNLFYLIIGEGEERDDLEGLVKELHLEDRVEFLGELPHGEAMEYMSCCDIFCLPSWNEAFGVVYLEAMGHGKPVIGCRGEGIDGTVRDRETGMLAEPRSVESLTDSLDYLLSNPAEADRIGMKAKKFVLEKYTWEESARTLLALYGKIIGENRRDSKDTGDKR